jgi:hypothetical protein
MEEAHKPLNRLELSLPDTKSAANRDKESALDSSPSQQQGRGRDDISDEGNAPVVLKTPDLLHAERHTIPDELLFYELPILAAIFNYPKYPILHARASGFCWPSLP